MIAEIVQHLERDRDEIIAAALYRSLPPERRTLRADVTANHTIESLLEWASGESEDAVLARLQRAVEATWADAELLHVHASTVSAALDLLSARQPLTPDVRDRFAGLQRKIDVYVSAYRKSRRGNEIHAVDAVDAKIEDLLYSLASADALTAEHSRSVSMWCSRIAKRLSLPREEQIFATRSGLLHDVGKLKTPVEILLAPRRLTVDEWAIMKMHAVEGTRMVEGIPELRCFIPPIRFHHERYDGRGYPDCLGNIDIPLHARIVAVADAFNAMIARRPYRAPLSPAAALEELKRNSGTQFDRVIVEAMIDVILQ
jgi:HD-GYP domain-containing protein (c-di-GMP phosphodiesterase class II)